MRLAGRDPGLDLLFHAEFTRVYAAKRGRHIFPRNKAVPLTNLELARQGVICPPSQKSPVQVR